MVKVIMGTKGKPQTKSSSSSPSSLAKAYLILYNLVQTLGWSYLLYQLVTHYVPGDAKSGLSLWDKTFWTVMIFQNAAVLEIVNTMLGLVHSSVMTTIMQVYSRVFVVCGVLLVTQAAPAGIGLPLSLLAWSVTEIIRYGYYTLNLVGMVPYILTFLRYTLFIILYPIGITGELICIYHASEEVAENKMWTVSLPNAYNFVFNYQYFLIGYMFLYIPIFPMLYGHMFTQRKKILRNNTVSKDKKVK